MGLNALASSTRRDALATRATARRRVFEPDAARSPEALARTLPEVDIEPPAGMPRYLELGPGVRALPPPDRVPPEVEAASHVPGDEAAVPATEPLPAEVTAAPVAGRLDAPTDEAGASEPQEEAEAETLEEIEEGEQAEEGEETAAEGEAAERDVAEDGATGEAAGTLPPEAAGDLLAAAMDDTALIDEELAEHERWAGSFGELGTAGSDERARFLLDQAGEGASAGFWGGVGMGAVMGAAGGALGHIAGRRLATLAVSRGALAVPVPGLGSAIGGVMAIAGLFTRDWGASFDTIGRIGTGEGYEGLANDLEGIAEALDMACTFMDIVGGICGAIAVGMWVGAVLSGGALAPLALTLSAIGTGIGIATTAVGLIINVAVRPAVTALRALHAFESQGDPAEVEAAGASLSSAAAQLTGAAGGALGGRAGGHVGTRGGAGLYRAGTAVAARSTGGRPAMSATAGPGPRVHAEMPEAPTAAARPDAPATPTASARPAAADGPAASSPARRSTEPYTGESPHPITPDVVIRGDFSDASINVLSARNRGAANAGDIGPHRMHGSRGTGLISEHVIPGAQMRDATIDPSTGTPDWQRSTPGGSDGSDYRNATTIVEHGAVAARKTAMDNAATTALQRGGGPRNLVEDLLLPSLDRHERATADAIRAGEIRPDQATDPTHRALAALAEMWGGGSAGGGARARADAAASGGSASLPRSRPARVEAEAARTRARIAEEGGITDIDWDATFSHPDRSADAGGPAASSPRRTAPDAASPTGVPPRYAPHTETVRTPDRAAAMAQYHEQIRTDPSRESGVWRGPDGTFYVMQGDGGSVRPPSASGPLTLVYHSHPVEADAAYRGLVSQPSQARGDFGVLAHQHGTGGPAGRRVESELHFPTYGPDGTHSGFGATRFAYDPTSPLPLQVTTTLPGGRPATQRYASYADFEARTGVRAGGDTPAASTAARVDADARLTADRAAAARRIDETAAGLTGFTPPVGASVGRDEARTAAAEAAAGAPGTAKAPGRGPAYAVSVAGLAPGESMELPINPAYPSPPGTPEQLDALLDQVDTARGAADALGDTEARMTEHEAVEHEHAAGLEEATGVSDDLGAEREAHAGAVDATAGTNDNMLAQAGEAYDSLGESARNASALASLVVSLQAFRGMANLFSYLPGNLGARAETARNDSARLITTLNRVSDADTARGEVGAGREAIEGDGERIEAVAGEGESTDAGIAEGASALAELEAANAESLAETEAAHALATQERRAAEDSETEAQGAHDTLLAELQAWAQAHRQAREDAVAQALGTCGAMGLNATEMHG